MDVFRLIFVDLTSGRLFQEIREKKALVYSIRSIHCLYDHIGYLSIVTNIEPKNLDILLVEFKKHIDYVKDNGLSQKEFEIAKKNYTSMLSLDLDNSRTLAEYNAYELFYKSNNFTTYFDTIKYIKKITLNEINKFINKLLSIPPIITIINPTK